MTVQKPSVPTVVNLIPVDQRTEETLVKMYSEKIQPVTEHIRQRLIEYIRYVRLARDKEGDWFQWFHEAIMTVATKTTVEQRQIGYFIGLLKAWLTYGFGTFYNAEFIKLLELFEEKFGVQTSRACSELLSKLIQEYGIVYATGAVLNTSDKDTQTDMSLIYADACKRFAEVKYYKIGGRDRNERSDTSITGRTDHRTTETQTQNQG